MDNQIQGYGYVSDTDESLKSKTGGKFGLNQNCFLTKFAYNPNVSKEGQPVREAIEIVVQVGDKEFKDWVAPITQVYVKNVVTTTFTTPEAITEYNAALRQQGGLVTHYLKAMGVTEDAIKNALTLTPITSFADYAQRLCALLPAGYNTRPVDVFLEYQWNIGTKENGESNGKTFPTLPRSMKGGYFIVGARGGVYTEDTTDGGLKYIENTTRAEHPLFRSKDFMESKKGFQQIEGQDNAGPANAAFTPVAGAAQTSTWETPAAGQA